VMARLCHPDRGGSTEAMQQINGAYAALRERVSA
jgi:curved DNA-binding protein CbpA